MFSLLNFIILNFMSIKRIIIILGLIVFVNIETNSQSFNIEWQGCFGGSDKEYT